MMADPTHPRLSCIGGGNMARALLGGLLQRGWPADRIQVSEPHAGTRDALAADLGCQVGADNRVAAEGAEVLLLAVKPQVMAAVCTELAPLKQTRAPLVISIAAGIRAQSMRDWLGPQVHIVRCMPNTPALIGAGITAMCAGAEVTEAERELTTRLMQAVGDTVWIDREELLDAVTAVSGSGPAYFFALMEALIDAAQQQGLPPEVARQLVLKTAAGAASLALASAESPAVLRQRVTSPGGTTQAALEVFQARGLHAAAIAAVAAATARGTELSAALG